MNVTRYQYAEPSAQGTALTVSAISSYGGGPGQLALHLEHRTVVRTRRDLSENIRFLRPDTARRRDLAGREAINSPDTGQQGGLIEVLRDQVVVAGGDYERDRTPIAHEAGHSPDVDARNRVERVQDASPSQKRHRDWRDATYRRRRTWSTHARGQRSALPT